MLAYVFWHVRRADIAAPDYEAAHRSFHDALWRTPVAGLVSLRDVPWLEPRQEGYEDWHLLENSAALDVLNEAAVIGAREGVHERIAGMALSGTAGLYGLRLGVPIEPAMAYWMSKPAGMKYPDFYDTLRPLIDAGCCLWGRRMTLGPTPEFCLHARAAVPVPHATQTLRVEMLHRHDYR